MGNVRRGDKNDSYGGSQSSGYALPAREDAALAGIRAQEQKRVNRNARMNRLQRNTGFVEDGPKDRNMTRPEACHQCSRPGGCQRGNKRRYARNDPELRLLEDLTRRGKKIPP